MKRTQAVEAALRFAAALDAGDWKAAESCLARDCEYLFRGDATRGAEMIIGMYRTIGEWVDETFESVRYESSVEAEGPDRARIAFRDLLDHRGHHLDFRCDQVITVGAGETIVRIEHIDLPGEPEKVERFNRAWGVQKPQAK